MPRVYAIKDWQSFFYNNCIQQQKCSQSTMESHETYVSNQWPQQVNAIGTVQQHVVDKVTG